MRTRRHIERTAFAVVLLIFVFVGLFVLSGCQSYQPPGEGIWRAL